MMQVRVVEGLGTQEGTKEGTQNLGQALHLLHFVRYFEVVILFQRYDYQP